MFHHASSSTVLRVCTTESAAGRMSSLTWQLLGCLNQSSACWWMRCGPLGCSNMPVCCITELATAYRSSHLMVNLSPSVRVKVRAPPVGASVAHRMTSSGLLTPCLLGRLMNSCHPCCCLCLGSLGCGQALGLMLPGHLVVAGSAIKLKAIRSPAANSGKESGGL